MNLSGTKSKRKKMLGGGIAALALAASFTVAGGMAAYASGSCTSFSMTGSAPSYLVGRCAGTVVFQWQCSTDLLGTWNVKTINYGATYNTRSTLACNEGHAVNYSYHS